jgi:phosphonate transport system substrate-binding protein
MALTILKKLLILSAFLPVLAFSACQPKAAPASEALSPLPDENLSRDQILSIGVVSSDPAGTIESYQPLADFLSKQMSSFGIKQGIVINALDLDAMVEKLKSGEVDIYYESPYGAMYAYEKAGAIPLVRGWRNGVGEYHSVVMVRKDSGIVLIEGLKGKLIAFSGANSTTGYFLPKSYLLTAGFSLSEQSTAGSIPSDEIGYTITGSPENMINAILLGKVVGGAEESRTYDDLTQEQKDQIAILCQTKDLPRSLMMASPKTTRTFRDQLSVVLKQAGDTEAGKAAMQGAEKTTKFDDFPLGPQGTMDFLEMSFAAVK